MNTKIVPWIVMLAVVGTAVGIIMLAVNKRPESALSPVAVTLQSDEIWKGKEDASVVLVEYADFQCPACASYAPLVKKIAGEFGDRIKIVFRHFPLRQHANADVASRAAQAAHAQGKFWELHDHMFEEQQAWASSKNPEDLFVQYALLFGLDKERFLGDMNSAETRAKVEADTQSGFQARVPGTPSFFLQGRMIQNPRNYDDFKALILNALKQSS